jgi:Glycosyltransferase WbsX
MEKKAKVRVIAFYLPQYHPIPENDSWWGNGFTEWTNVAKAKPLYKGHNQPKIPADLGFYDLRLPETRKAQAEMAKKYGIEGFCYWHYWFGNGKRLLERPFNEVLNSGEPDFPFCLAWANHSWKLKTWTSDGTDKLLIEQEYPGTNDYIAHFNAVLPAFRDKRYITIDGKPLFVIFSPLEFADVKYFMELWRELALKNGLTGIYFVGKQDYPYVNKDKILAYGFDSIYNDSVLAIHLSQTNFKRIMLRLKIKLFNIPRIYQYADAIKLFRNNSDSEVDTIPAIIPNWDHTPRSGLYGTVLAGSTPELFKKHVGQVFESIKAKPKENQLVFLKSWNEWGEGNYIEPDIKDGLSYLKAMQEAIREFEN